MESAVTEALAEKIKKVKLIILDVDGVMTDGGIIYNDAGQETKRFDVRDGHGIKLAMRAGIDVALVTARESQAVLHRARNLGIELLYQGMRDKVKAFDDLLIKKALTPAEIAYIGDDLVDLPIIKRAGFSAAVPDAVPEVKERVDYVTAKPGGGGAVRETIELILKTQGKWDGIIELYFS